MDLSCGWSISFVDVGDDASEFNRYMAALELRRRQQLQMQLRLLHQQREMAKLELKGIIAGERAAAACHRRSRAISEKEPLVSQVEEEEEEEEKRHSGGGGDDDWSVLFAPCWRVFF